MTKKTIDVWLVLLEEGTPTIRATTAEFVGDGLYKLLPTPDYDPEDEIWEFLPGTIVRVREVTNDGDRILQAYVPMTRDEIIAQHPGKEITQIVVGRRNKKGDIITDAIIVDKNIYRLLPTPDYDFTKDIWDHLAGSFVNAFQKNGPDGKIILGALDQVSWGRNHSG